MDAVEEFRPQVSVTPTVGASLRTLLMFSLAVAVALAVHLFVSKKEPALETRSYTVFLCAVLATALLTAPAQLRWKGLRRWRQNMHPILTAAALLLCFWEIITSGLRLLPLPYFPGPAKVLQSLIGDRALLFDSTWHSLILLVSGYALGVIAGLISGICIGWSSPIRYWGMPVLKVVVMGMECRSEVFLCAVREGVAGYLLQDATAAEICSAVRCVANNGAACSPELCQILFQQLARQPSDLLGFAFNQAHGMTRREHQVMELVARGLTNKEIAIEFGLSEQTVKNHMHHVLRKLGVPNRLAVAQLWNHQGLLPA